MRTTRGERVGRVMLVAMSVVLSGCGRTNPLDYIDPPGGLGGTHGDGGSGGAGSSNGGSAGAASSVGGSAGSAGAGGSAGSGGSGGSSGGSGGLGGTGGGGSGGDAGSGAVGGGGSGGVGGTGGDAGSGGVGGGGSGGDGGTGGDAGSGGVGGDAGSGGDGGSGGSSECTTDNDCASVDFCNVGHCVQEHCEFTPADRDEDGYIDEACGGDDCNDANPLAHVGAPELCTDGTDNDCNGVADCFDPSCATADTCGCTTIEPEICDNGEDDDCDERVDCSDADCVGVGNCGCLPEVCGNGRDDDCDGRIDCDDSDCATAEECVCRTAFEQCTNGEDDDCDGRIDCADPECRQRGECLCITPSFEICDDHVDNDCDGAVDCADPSCFANPACSLCTVEVCDSEQDEDCNGLVDCADPACAFAANCTVTAELCNNALDDDLDTLIDCDDDDCANNPHCIEEQDNCTTARRIEPGMSSSYQGNTTGHSSHTVGSCGGDAGEAVFELVLNESTRVHLDTVGSSFDTVLYVRQGSCTLGVELDCDDDGAGSLWSSRVDFDGLPRGTYYVFVDGLALDPSSGPDEGPFVLNVELDPIASEVCDDGVDNDGNRYADCADPACTDEVHCAHCNRGGPATPEYGPEACTDGEDNDCDGTIDCDDDDCSASEEFVTECCTGTDQNDNGIADDFNCRCASDADCVLGQICYTSTLGACGLACDNFVGQLCPFLAPGSTCNPSTLQCEF